MLTGPRAVRGRQRGDHRAQAGQRGARCRRGYNPAVTPGSRPSCCARWRRTRRAASATPTSSSPRCEAARDGDRDRRAAAAPPPRAVEPPPSDGLPPTRRATPLPAARGARRAALVARGCSAAARRRPRASRRCSLLTGRAQKVTVPTWSAADQADAEADAAQGGLRDRRRRTEDARTAARAASSARTRPAGTKAEKGSTVDAHRVRRPGAGRVPRSWAYARVGARATREGRLRSHGQREETTDTVEKGQVIAASPGEGEKVDKGIDGDARGLQRPGAGRGARRQRQAARRGAVAAAGAGLQGHADRQGVADKDPGTVLAQNPPRGTQVDQGLDRRRSPSPRRRARSRCPT